jgi:hypothetical protein
MLSHWQFEHLQPKLWAKEGPGVKQLLPILDDFLKDKTTFFRNIFHKNGKFLLQKKNTTLNITNHKLFIVVLASALCLHAHSQFIYSEKIMNVIPFLPIAKKSLNSRRISASKMMRSVIFHITFYDE